MKMISIVFGVAMFVSGMVAGAAIMANRCDEKSIDIQKELQEVSGERDYLINLVRREAPWLHVHYHGKG